MSTVFNDIQRMNNIILSNSSDNISTEANEIISKVLSKINYENLNESESNRLLLSLLLQGKNIPDLNIAVKYLFSKNINIYPHILEDFFKIYSDNNYNYYYNQNVDFLLTYYHIVKQDKNNILNLDFIVNNNYPIHTLARCASFDMKKSIEILNYFIHRGEDINKLNLLKESFALLITNISIFGTMNNEEFLIMLEENNIKISYSSYLIDDDNRNSLLANSIASGKKKLCNFILSRYSEKDYLEDKENIWNLMKKLKNTNSVHDEIIEMVLEYDALQDKTVLNNSLNISLLKNNKLKI